MLITTLALALLVGGLRFIRLAPPVAREEIVAETLPVQNLDVNATREHAESVLESVPESATVVAPRLNLGALPFDAPFSVPSEEERASRRAELLKRVEEETFAESLALLREEFPTELFFPRFSSMGINMYGEETRLLCDPRIAKIVDTATHASAEEKAAILGQVIQALDDHLVVCEQAVRTGESTSHNSMAALPIVLAELDATGESLPLLLEWYRYEVAAVEKAAKSLVKEGTLTPEQASAIQTQVMSVVASAAYEIMWRAYPEIEWDENFFPGGRPMRLSFDPTRESSVYSRNIDDLVLLPDLSFGQGTEVMARLESLLR